jgi:ribA/ribD-fused uncharacterized protein
MMDITEFKGQHRWLSNFWSCRVELDGMLFPSVEHAYVAAKTTDKAVRRNIQSLATASECKRFGKSIRLREDWEAVKLSIMEDLLRQKFAPGTSLAAKLVATGNVQLIEGNQWGDTYWGVYHGVGHNHLGKLLMDIRRGLVYSNSFIGESP